MLYFKNKKLLIIMPPFVESDEKETTELNNKQGSTVVKEQEENKHPDYRAPLYVGSWKRSIPYVDEHFAVDDMD
ncbi:unnamed protein product [Cunninghamella blakesleeana]